MERGLRSERSETSDSWKIMFCLFNKCLINWEQSREAKSHSEPGFAVRRLRARLHIVGRNYWLKFHHQNNNYYILFLIWQYVSHRHIVFHTFQHPQTTNCSVCHTGQCHLLFNARAPSIQPLLVCLVTQWWGGGRHHEKVTSVHTLCTNGASPK